MIDKKEQSVIFLATKHHVEYINMVSFGYKDVLYYNYNTFYMSCWSECRLDLLKNKASTIPPMNLNAIFSVSSVCNIGNFGISWDFGRPIQWPLFV